MATLTRLQKPTPAAVQSPGDRAETIGSIVRQPKYAERFTQVLGDKAPLFVSSVISIASNPKMSGVDPHSIIASCMIGAALDLPVDPNLGFMHIVPYKGYAQAQIGYKGFVQLAIRTGQYRFINATSVYEGELLDYNKLTGKLVLDPSKRTSDKVIGYAAYLELVNGFSHAEYWTDEEITQHSERYSQAVRSKKMDSPWFTDREAMAKKTVLKDLISHWGIMSIKLQQAIIEDQGFHRSIDTEVEYIDNDRTKIAEAPKFFDGIEDAKLPETPEPNHPVVVARGLLAKLGKTEAQILEQLRKGGLDPSLSSLDEVYAVSPSEVESLVDSLHSAAR